jgi:hypothetical protein
MGGSLTGSSVTFFIIISFAWAGVPLRHLFPQKPHPALGSLSHFRSYLWESRIIEKIRSKYDNEFALNI